MCNIVTHQLRNIYSELTKHTIEAVHMFCLISTNNTGCERLRQFLVHTHTLTHIPEWEKGKCIFIFVSANGLQPVIQSEMSNDLMLLTLFGWNCILASIFAYTLAKYHWKISTSSAYSSVRSSSSNMEILHFSLTYNTQHHHPNDIPWSRVFKH